MNPAMGGAMDAPALIQYACERCKTKFVLPPSSRRLGFSGRLKATGSALGQSLKHRQGFGSSYDSARRQILAKMDDDAYQAFVQSFKFCHECRQFVCSECWSNSRKTCLGCFARAAGTTIKAKPPFVPDGPSIQRPAPAFAPAKRKGHLRRDAGLLLAAAAVILIVVEAVIALPTVMAKPGGNGDPIANVTDPPKATATIAPTDSPTPEPTATPTPTPEPTASPTESPSPSPSPSPTPAPTTGPVKTAPPTLPTPKITCGPNPAAAGATVTCRWTNLKAGYTTFYWKISQFGSGAQGTKVSPFGFTFYGDPTTVRLIVVYYGKTYGSATITIAPA